MVNADDIAEKALLAMQSGPFDTLKAISDLIADAINDGYTESEGSFVIKWKGVDLRISVAQDKGE